MPTNPYQTPGWNPGTKYPTTVNTAGSGPPQSTANPMMTPPWATQGAIQGAAQRPAYAPRGNMPIDGSTGTQSSMPGWLGAEIAQASQANKAAGGLGYQSPGAGGAGGRGARRLPGVPNASFSWQPPGEAQTPGAYHPGKYADNAMQSANAAKAARAAQLAQLGYSQRRIQEIMASDSMTSGPAASSGSGGAGYGGGSAGGRGGSLASDFQAAQDAANARNEARYGNMLLGLDERMDRNMGYLDAQGATERQDINESYSKLGAKQKQSLASKGLGNTTVGAPMEASLERDRLREQGRLNERLNAQRIGIDSTLSGDILEAIERRTDQGPDYGMLAQLAQALGAGAGGMGAAAQPQYVSPGALFSSPVPAWMGGGVGGGGYAPPGGGGGGGWTLRDQKMWEANNGGAQPNWGGGGAANPTKTFLDILGMAGGAFGSGGAFPALPAPVATGGGSYLPYDGESFAGYRDEVDWSNFKKRNPGFNW